jgi:hypothetical protein
VIENTRTALDGIAMTRPDDLLYAVDEMPPWPRLVVLGMQHAMLLSVNLVLIVIVFRRAGVGDAATLSALSLGMIALRCVGSHLSQCQTRVDPLSNPGRALKQLQRARQQCPAMTFCMSLSER